MTSLRHRFFPSNLTKRLALGLFSALLLCPFASAQQQAEVLIYGATPGGIAAAVAAAQDGRSVLLIEPTARIGGLTTSGLSHSDFHSFESLTGAFLDFSRRVESYYAKTYGPDSQQVRDSFRGTFGEPKVNLAIFEQMLTELPKITTRQELVLQTVKMDTLQGRRRIQSANFAGKNGVTTTLAAKVFIDATYEGDLMAMAGVPWRAGREGKAEFDESLAPDEADNQLQAYNFRWVMTRDEDNRVTPVAPLGYRREDFVGVLDALQTPRIKTIFNYPRECIFKAQTPPLPNGKYDINDVSTGLVRLSLPGKNLDWPNGNAKQRRAVFDEHQRDQVGLLYFLQNDEAVPAKFREEARQWGWCRDEFTETGHLPPQLYVREARRMQGVHVFQQRDSEHAPGDARAVLHKDAIAMGDYGNNCHGTAHEGLRFGGKHTGEFYNPVPPYQIPYGVLLPKDVENLLVPVAASSSHVGFCALRLEPIWMSLGQAAGHAAAQAVDRNIAVQNVDVRALQHRLLAAGSATIYVSDVLPGHPDFAAVQWWGTVGGLHGLAPMPAKPGQRGKNIGSQYSEAAPGHAAELDRPLDASLADRWTALAKEQRLTADKLPRAGTDTTRGNFIRAAWRMHQEQVAGQAAAARTEVSQAVAAMEKIADLALIPPVLNTSPLPDYDYDRLDYGMTIGLERTPSGRLWACWVAGGDSPKAFFVLATSDDDGETWSKPRLVVDAHDKSLPAERSILVGNLWTDPLGRLWLIFDQSMDMFDGRAGVWMARCDNPDAEQPTWSPPRRIWHGVTLNKPTVLSTGEWMLPISLDQRDGFRQFKGCFRALDPLRGANVFVSSDQGKTWERRGAARFPNPDWHEHMLVERKDKSLWMLARTRPGLMQSTSTDGGRTWAEPTAPLIQHPAARFHIRRLASDRLLLVKHGKTIEAHEGRSQLTAWLSDDDGATWRGGLMLDERKGISYPDGVQAPDGTIYISYDRNRSTDGEVLLARFTEDDILAGRLVSPKSKLQMLISRPLARKAGK